MAKDGGLHNNEVLAAAIGDEFGLDPVDVVLVIQEVSETYYGYTGGEMRAVVNAAIAGSGPEDVAHAIAEAVLRTRAQGRAEADDD